MAKDKYALFHLDGGVGKHIAATAVIKAYKHQHKNRKVIVVCAWPEIFLGNTDIFKVYRTGNTPHFYKDYIYNKDTKIFAHEPYKEASHILKQTHLIETWCKLVDVSLENAKTDITCNFREQEEALSLIVNPSKKPVLIIQPFGGPLTDIHDSNDIKQQFNYSWMRDIHPGVAQQIVDKLVSKYHIVHICNSNHPQLQHVQRIDQILPKKVLISLLLFSNKRLLIDSSLQHAAAALNLPSTVVWVATQHNIFGYDIHKNIVPNKTYPEGTVDSYLYDYDFTGRLHECVYSSAADIYDADTIINAIES